MLVSDRTACQKQVCFQVGMSLLVLHQALVSDGTACQEQKWRSDRHVAHEGHHALQLVPQADTGDEEERQPGDCHRNELAE